MDLSNLEPLRECSDTHEKTQLVIYDGGSKPDTPVLVCQFCFENFEIFRKFIKNQLDIKCYTKIITDEAKK